MLLHWSIERIHAPSNARQKIRSEWTDEGEEYKKLCKDNKLRPQFKPGVHYIAVESIDRILLPEIEALCGLRHCWCWERRERLHIPTWFFTQVPRIGFSPEENARLLCVYMRPWTLNPSESSCDNPLLSDLGKCLRIDNNLIPSWCSSYAPSWISSHAAGNKRRRLRTKKACNDIEAQASERYSYATSWDHYIHGNVVSDTSRRYIVNLLTATAAIKAEKR